MTTIVGEQRGRKIGRRLYEILTTERAAIPMCYTGQVQAARLAEADGLLKIDQYLAQNQGTMYPGARVGACYYTLSPEGLRLRQSLLAGETPHVKKQTDGRFDWLIEQSEKLCFKDFGAPEAGFDYNKMLRTLLDVATGWLDHAAQRTGVERNRHRFQVYRSDEDCDDLTFTEVDIHPHDLDLRIGFELCANFYLRSCAELHVKLECGRHEREYFRRVLRDYPLFLADILKYGRNVGICFPPAADEPPKGLDAMGRLRAVLASEEHFHYQDKLVFRFRAGQGTVIQSIRSGMICLLALYEAVSASEGYNQEPHKLVALHQKLFANRSSGGKKNGRLISA